MTLCTWLKWKKRASSRLVHYPRHPVLPVHSPQWTTQVMSRHGNEPESQIVLKRPRQENRLVQLSIPNFIPRNIVSNVQGFDMFPAIHGVQDHMSNWMSSLIQAQDGCLQMVAQRVPMDRVQQEQLAQTVAQRAIMPSTSDQISYFRAQLAH